MSKEEISRQAYLRWEAEGRPDDQHERHWREAEEATQSNALPQTWSSDHAGGISPKTGPQRSKSEARRSGERYIVAKNLQAIRPAATCRADTDTKSLHVNLS